MATPTSIPKNICATKVNLNSQCRDHHDVRFVYTAEVHVAEEDEPAILKRTAHASPRVEQFVEPPFHMPDPGPLPLQHRPVVVGSGPGVNLNALLDENLRDPLSGNAVLSGIAVKMSAMV